MEIANQKASCRGKDETVPFRMNSVMGGIPDLGYCASCAGCDIVREQFTRKGRKDIHGYAGGTLDTAPSWRISVE